MRRLRTGGILMVCGRGQLMRMLRRACGPLTALVAICLLLHTTSTLISSSAIPVVVVEEHHEVLHHWFDAVHKGILPKTGNTLLHVDGHSDMAPPEIPYPYFDWPGKRSHVTRMMQKNDAFIQAACMAGLFSRIIWLWPSWDPTLSEDGSHNLSIGWYRPPGSRGERYLCECETAIREHRCMYLNDSINDLNSTSACAIVRTVEVIAIKGEDALERIERDPGWIRPSEPVLLDMDHDYFGCENGGVPITTAGVNWTKIENLDGRLSRFLCPKNIHHEEVGDRLLKDCIAEMLRQCHRGPTGRCSVTLNSMVSLTKPILTQVYLVEPSLFCSQTLTKIVKKFKLVLAKLYSMKPSYLRSLLEVGFCLTTSPATFRGHIKLQVCHGANPPNDPIVNYHTPEPDELASRMSGLSLFLSRLPRSTVRLVTLCRSIRDGYTPKKYFETIETGVIQALHRMHGEDRLNVIYDDNLLHGAKGLPYRYKPNLQPQNFN